MGFQTEKAQKRESTRSLLLPPAQENPIINSSRKKDALGGAANTHSVSCQLTYSTAQRGALLSSQMLSSASHFSFATHSLWFITHPLHNPALEGATSVTQLGQWGLTLHHPSSEKWRVEDTPQRLPSWGITATLLLPQSSMYKYLLQTQLTPCLWFQ